MWRLRAYLIEQGLGILDNLSSGEGEEGLLFAKVAPKGRDVDAACVVETPVMLTYGDGFGAGLVEELG
jgi:hypothetical protein